MNRTVFRALVSLTLIAVISGCSHKIAEIDVRYGELTDAKTGYFAYWRGLAARDENEVCMGRASRAEIERELEFRAEDEHLLFPQLAYPVQRRFVEPEQVAALLPGCPASDLDYPDTLVIGRFAYLLVRDPDQAYVGGAAPGKSKSVTWTTLSSRALENARETILAMRSRAALEGADAILELAISSARGGVTVTGLAVVFGKVASAPKSSPSWVIPF